MFKAIQMFLLEILLAQLVNAQKRPLPVIDMHLHALHANDQGPAPLNIGAPFQDLGINDPKDDFRAVFNYLNLGVSKVCHKKNKEPIYVPVSVPVSHTF